LGVRWEVVIARIKWDRPGAEDGNIERKRKEGEKKSAPFFSLHHLFGWE
jgi:hypothetical protein